MSKEIFEEFEHVLTEFNAGLTTILEQSSELSNNQSSIRAYQKPLTLIINDVKKYISHQGVITLEIQTLQSSIPNNIQKLISKRTNLRLENTAITDNFIKSLYQVLENNLFDYVKSIIDCAFTDFYKQSDPDIPITSNPNNQIDKRAAVRKKNTQVNTFKLLFQTKNGLFKTKKPEALQSIITTLITQTGYQKLHKTSCNLEILDTAYGAANSYVNLFNNLRTILTNLPSQEETTQSLGSSGSTVIIDNVEGSSLSVTPPFPTTNSPSLLMRSKSLENLDTKSLHRANSPTLSPDEVRRAITDLGHDAPSSYRP